MTLNQALIFIANQHGRLFSVRFRKRTDNQLREMLCRTGVRAALKGGKAAYDPAKKGLVWVYDMTKQAYRSINVEGLLAIKIDGEWEEITV